jgi:hypothetical protein
MAGNLTVAATRAAQAEIAQLMQTRPVEAAITAFQATHPNMAEADVTRLFQSVTASPGGGAGSVIGRVPPVSSASTPPMTDSSHRLSNPLVNDIVTSTLRQALGDRFTSLDTGSVMIYLDATVENTSDGLTMATLDQVQVYASGLNLSEGEEQALIRDIRTALNQSGELEGLLITLAGKSTEGSDASNIYLASDIRFGGSSHLAGESIRLPPQGHFSPVAGRLTVNGRTAEGITYSRSFDNILIAPTSHPGIPQPGEGGDPYVLGDTTYYPVPYRQGTAYHADCGYVLLSTLDDATSTPHEILRSTNFTRAGRGYLSFTPPQAVVMTGS